MHDDGVHAGIRNGPCVLLQPRAAGPVPCALCSELLAPAAHGPLARADMGVLDGYDGAQCAWCLA